MEPLIAGRFEVLRALDSGGTGDVLLVRDSRDGRRCALKRLRAGDPEIELRGRDEFAWLSRIQHPNIVRVFDYGVLPEGGAWITMEHLEGSALDAAVRPGDVTSALRAARDIIAGLDALHATGHFHGDIKPSNVFLAHANPDVGGAPSGRAVLIDFGFMGRHSEIPGGRKRGTPGYLSPEILQGSAPYGRASDAYALGATLYRVLSGRLAFPGRDVSEILSVQARGMPSILPLENAGVPPSLNDLVLRLLAQDPDARLSAMLELRQMAERRLAVVGEHALASVLATSGPVFGRESELARVREHTLGGSDIRIAAIVGAPGSGRTRLAREVAIDAELDGWSVEWFDASHLPVTTDVEWRGDDDRMALLILDDVDEWPPGALKSYRPPDLAGRLAIVATARSTQFDRQPFARWALSLREGAAPLIVELSPLPASALNQLVQSRLSGNLPAGLLEALAQEAAGLPGRVASVLDQLVRSGALRRTDADWTLAAGETAESAIRTALDVQTMPELTGLSELGRRALLSIAGSPEPVTIADVARTANADDSESEAALDELEWKGLLEREANQLRVVPAALERFALEQLDDSGLRDVRQNLRSSMRTAPEAAARARWLRYRGCHERLLGDDAAATETWAEAWQSRPADDQVEANALTRVLEQAPLGVNSSAISLLAAVAAYWQEKSRPNVSERLWQRVETLVSSSGESGEAHPDFALGHARCLFAQGQYAAGVDRLSATLGVPSSTGLPPQTRGRILIEVAWGEAMLARFGPARAHFEEALDVFPANVGVDRAVTLNRYGSFLTQWGEYPAARTRLDEGLELALSLEDRALESRLRGNLAQLAAHEGRYADARRELERAVSLARELRDSSWLPALLTNLLTLHAQIGDWVAWRQTFDETIGWARSSGDIALLCGACEAWQSLELRRGNLADVRRAWRLERSWLRYSDRPDQHAHNRIIQAVVHGLSGDERGARRSLRASHDADTSARRPLNAAQASLALGELELRRGNLARARRWFERVLEIGPKTQSLAIHAMLGALRTISRSRDSSGFSELAPRMESSLVETPIIEANAIRAELEAMDAALRLDDAECERKYNSAVESLEELGLSLRAIETLWEAVATLRALGQKDRARGLLIQAWTLAQSRGIRAWMSRIAVELVPLDEARSVTDSSRDKDRPGTRDLLAQVGELLNSLLDYPALLQKSLELVGSHLRAERGYILLVDAETGEIRPMAEIGAVDESSHDKALGVSRTVVRRVAESGAAFRAEDAAQDPRLGSTQSVLDLAVRSLLCTPLRLRERVIGTIYLESRSSAAQFQEADLSLVDAFANLMAIAIENSREHDSLRRSRDRVVGEIVSLRSEVGARFGPSNIIGRSSDIERLVGEIERVAVGRGPVLITGETGTGKDLVAKTIHFTSARRERPFIPLNCAALPEQLIESELFGIKNRTATGVVGRPGVFERAHGGTVFLDEIADMPEAIQAKLLHVLQDGQFAPVGSSGSTVRVDVRILAATNKNIKALVREGRFRSDLYYRIQTFPIHIAPLRERRVDILPLAQHFLRKFCEDNGRPIPTLSPALITVLQQDPWEGNVRQLQNYMERLTVMSPGPVLLPVFKPSEVESTPLAEFSSLGTGPATVQPNAILGTGKSLRSAVDEFEIELIRHALSAAQGNQRQAARMLGLVEPTLRYRMGKLGIGAQPKPPLRRGTSART